MTPGGSGRWRRLRGPLEASRFKFQGLGWVWGVGRLFRTERGFITGFLGPYKVLRGRCLGLGLSGLGVQCFGV